MNYKNGTSLQAGLVLLQRATYVWVVSIACSPLCLEK